MNWIGIQTQTRIRSSLFVRSSLDLPLQPDGTDLRTGLKISSGFALAESPDGRRRLPFAYCESVTCGRRSDSLTLNDESLVLDGRYSRRLRVMVLRPGAEVIRPEQCYRLGRARALSALASHPPPHYPH